jgi:hypothetical protein
MKNLIRIPFILAVLALPGVALAAVMPGLGSTANVLPLSVTVPAAKPDCWVDHVQVQPGNSSGASGSESVIGNADIGKLETAGHPGSEHRNSRVQRSSACSEQLELLPSK